MTSMRLVPGRPLFGAFVAVNLALACSGGKSPAAPTSTTAPATPGRHEVAIAANGITLGGILHRPETTETRAAIIILHGWQPAGTNGAALVEARARRYAEDGYVALALSMRGWPPSGGADDCALRQPDDTAAAAAWLRTQPGVRSDRIAIVGFSQGGQVALMTPLRDPSIRAVVAYYPVTDVDRWKVSTNNADIPGYITQVCEPGGTTPRSPLKVSATLSTPVLLVHGDADLRVPTEQSVLMHSAMTTLGMRSELHLVPGAQHGFTAAEEAQVRPLVDAFLSQWLR
jgi:dipeptidyl aminopeptidase/acylaminoacyl peptidase